MAYCSQYAYRRRQRCTSDANAGGYALLRSLAGSQAARGDVLFLPLDQGSDALAVHESLDLDRFSRRWVQCLLPFRMPRFPRAD